MKNMKKKKIIVYDPYLDTLGGGERHILSIAKVFDQCGYHVDVIWNDASISDRLKKQFDMDFSHLSIVHSFFEGNIVSKFLETKKYEHFFYVTDGSYLFSGASHNHVFCMYPKKELYKATWINHMKWSNFDFICNSHFTKSFVDKWTGKESSVIYPYIDFRYFHKNHTGTNKQNIILSVGRFFRHLHTKRQDILIKAFNKLQRENNMFKDFKLYLIGGLKEEDKKYFDELVLLARDNDNIIFLPNASQTTVIEYYRKALFFWHAAGYDINEKHSPELVEHLGISPLEAMASGCIIFCPKKGELATLIKNGKNGFVYNMMDELVQKTIDTYNIRNTLTEIANQAQLFISEHFSYEDFKKRVITHFHLI